MNLKKKLFNRTSLNVLFVFSITCIALFFYSWTTMKFWNSDIVYIFDVNRITYRQAVELLSEVAIVGAFFNLVQFKR